MSDDENADAQRASEHELAANHEARGTSDPLHGAIHGKHSLEQMNSWEIAKVDLSSEQRIAQDMMVAKGESPASRADEAVHGDGVAPVEPEELTGEGQRVRVVAATARKSRAGE